MARKVRQRKTTFSPHWNARIDFQLEKSGMKEAELLRDAVKDRIERMEQLRDSGKEKIEKLETKNSK